jgi:hypothetical protein
VLLQVLAECTWFRRLTASWLPPLKGHFLWRRTSAGSVRLRSAEVIASMLLRHHGVDFHLDASLSSA